jgi:hypothetical protein
VFADQGWAQAPLSLPYPRMLRKVFERDGRPETLTHLVACALAVSVAVGRYGARFP